LRLGTQAEQLRRQWVPECSQAPQLQRPVAEPDKVTLIGPQKKVAQLVDPDFALSSPLQMRKSSTARRSDQRTQTRRRPMAENTVKLHRVLRAPAERIYRAFLDGDAMAKWLPPHGFTGKVHQIKAEVGGTYKMSFKNLTTGHSHSFGGEFVELVPNERIRHTDKFDDPNLPGQMQTTITLKKVSVGTELTVVQEGIPSVIPVEGCYLGWQESLTLLAQLVEAEIKE